MTDVSRDQAWNAICEQADKCEALRLADPVDVQALEAATRVLTRMQNEYRSAPA